MVVSQCGGPTAPSGDLLLKRVTSEGEAERDAMLRSSFGEDVVLLQVRADFILMRRCDASERSIRWHTETMPLTDRLVFWKLIGVGL